MNRRQLLKGLFGFAAATAVGEVDLDRLLWEPGAKTISIPELVTAKNYAKVFDHESGISMRLVRHYDIKAAKRVYRLDVLYGVADLRPELAMRLEEKEDLLFTVGEQWTQGPLRIRPDIFGRVMADLPPFNKEALDLAVREFADRVDRKIAEEVYGVVLRGAQV